MKREILILTGMSGAGRSTVARALEDLSWYVVDNLPPSLLPQLVSNATDAQDKNLAVVIDVRGGELFDDLSRALLCLESNGDAYQLLFLDATDKSLVQRFESTLRPHPLQGKDRIVDGIARERGKLEYVRLKADIFIDTTNFNVRQLKKRTGEIFASGKSSEIRINVLSFGYKYGIPLDSDLVLDCRFIPNPHWIPELQSLTGLTSQVSEKVLGSGGVTEFVKGYVALIVSIIPGYMQEGKKYLTIAVGCTGGKHRSVAVAEEIAKQLNKSGASDKLSAQSVHRDVVYK